MVRQSDLNALAALVEAGADIASLDEFPTYVVEGLPRLVPCDSISYNEVDPDPPRLVSVLEPASLRFPGDTELWELHAPASGRRPLPRGPGRARVQDLRLPRSGRLPPARALPAALPAPAYRVPDRRLPSLAAAACGRIALNRERRDSTGPSSTWPGSTSRRCTSPPSGRRGFRARWRRCSGPPRATGRRSSSSTAPGGSSSPRSARGWRSPSTSVTQEPSFRPRSRPGSPASGGRRRRASSRPRPPSRSSSREHPATGSSCVSCPASSAASRTRSCSTSRGARARPG
jgi:hypothetical protein